MKAVEKRGNGYSLSTGATTLLEKVAEYCPSVPKIMQLYNFKTEQQNRDFFQRIEKAGFDGIAVTVDTPQFGFRRADIYNNFALPGHLKHENITIDKSRNYGPFLPG